MFRAVFMFWADMFRRSFDSVDRLSSIICSMPFLPKITGTPMDRSVSPYSPSKGVVTLRTSFLPVRIASAMVAMAAAGANVVAPFNAMTCCPEVTV